MRVEEQQAALLQRFDVILNKLDVLIGAINNLVRSLGAQQLPQQPDWAEWLRAIEQSIERRPATPSTGPVVDIAGLFTPKSAYGTSAGTGLSVVLDTGGRIAVEVWVKSSGAAVFEISGSMDGEHYRVTDTITLTSAGEEHRGYNNAYKYIRVATAAKNNNEIEIVASR